MQTLYLVVNAMNRCQRCILFHANACVEAWLAVDALVVDALVFDV